MSADGLTRNQRQGRARDRLFAFGQPRNVAGLLQQLLPVLLAKAVAAVLLWWVMFGAHR